VDARFAHNLFIRSQQTFALGTQTTSKMAKLRWWHSAGLLVLALVLLGIAGSWLVSAAVAETYSPGWYSASTENAQYRGVYLKSPIVRPSILAINDSVAWAVTDAWIERPTRVRYRWYLVRRQERDSSYRLVVHFAQLVRDTNQWTFANGRSFASGEVLINGQVPARSGNANVQTLYDESSKQFPDTIRVSLRGK
jgi:hypothetical protein